MKLDTRRLASLLSLGVVLMSVALVGNAALFVNTAALSGASENPANASLGSGNTQVTLDTTAHTLQVSVVFTGLTGTTTMAHIHCCVAPPGNVGVATTTPTFLGFPVGVTSGTYNVILDTTQASTWNAAFITANGGTPAGAEAALAAGLAAGTSYLNIHTTAFPGGEIRGFLVPVAAATTSAIPTLSEWGLIGLLGLISLLGFGALRRKQ